MGFERGADALERAYRFGTFCVRVSDTSLIAENEAGRALRKTDRVPILGPGSDAKPAFDQHLGFSETAIAPQRLRCKHGRQRLPLRKAKALDFGGRWLQPLERIAVQAVLASARSPGPSTRTHG